MKKYTGLVGAGMFFSASQVLAFPAFVADAVHTTVEQALEVGKVFVSEQGSRFEFERRGQLVIQMILPEQGIMRLLFPQDLTYVEMTQLPYLRANLTPCPSQEVAKCELVSKETLHGRPVDIWNITFNQTLTQDLVNETPKSLQIWWDSERKLALQEHYSDGRITTSIIHGTVNYQGRFVESWEVSMINLEGKTIRILRWYDPELQTDIREEYQDGSIREFRNIHLVTPDSSWFTIPTGYTRIDPQTLHNNSLAPSISTQK